MKGDEHVVRKGTFYPTADGVPYEEQKALGLELPPAEGYRNRIKAIWTGEKRPPRKGEWYLSGSIVEAYRAPNDYLPTMSYHIARLVKVKTITITVIDDS
jgi:hypothetical protein